MELESIPRLVRRMKVNCEMQNYDFILLNKFRSLLNRNPQYYS